jgi:gamma-glutamylcyclotransferase (GGCT)/AIG2-like uncharacterized protein YtfP
MLYFAYGSNLNKAQMAARCPAATPLGRVTIGGFKLVFRGVADIVPDEDSVCYGGVWDITERCEAALDIYEGVRSGMYRKEMLQLEDGREMLVYLMNSTGIMPPSEGYLRSIERGYRDFKIGKPGRAALDAAVKASWDDKHPSHIERKRYRRAGRPRLAEPRDNGDQA